MGRDEGTEEFLGRGTTRAAVPSNHYMGVMLLGTWSLHRCVVQPPAVTSNRNEVSDQSSGPTFHLLPRGRHSAPVMRTRLPLDTGGLIRVRQRSTAA